CIPVYPRLYLSTDPDASVVRTARTFNATMPDYVVGRAEEILGDLTGLRVVVLGASYRGKVKETAFSGVFPTVDALRAKGAEVLVQDPMYTDEELAGFGWTPYHLGEAVDLAIVQADHPEYRELTPAQLPGVRLLLDGRRATDPALWAGTPRLVIGGGE
ncbi:UDP binding domain-containing protein, partial [Actinomyces radicidentis]|uniref:UDP binding domain-containing protein n=1 Tax=Actinomyces radicidentis TaxID=111015 RepID=UPI0028E27F61